MHRLTLFGRPASRTAAVVVLLAACANSSGRARSTATVPPAVATDDRPTGFPVACAPGEVQVMLLGTFHFEGSRTDAISGPRLDVRTPARQAELDDLVIRLARWAPEQIAVEWPAAAADSATARYARYVASGGATTSSNEVVQVAFRLARRLGQPTVYPIDYPVLLGNDSIGTVMRRRPDLRRRVDSVGAAAQAEAVARQRTEAEQTIVERLRAANTDSALHAGNSAVMFNLLAVGEGENRGGPQLLARWYERNFNMAHDLTRVLRPGTRRVLVLIGAGHVPPLRNILDESPQFCPVSPLPYLR